MAALEYLVSHGLSGEFGPFRAAAPVHCQRGDRVVIRGPRGLELGTVLCEATAGHVQLLDRGTVGELLRPATDEDEEIARGTAERARRLFDEARSLAADLALPLEILDVEIGLDGHQVTLHYLRGADCDERPLVRALSQKYETMVALRDLALPQGASGCGRPDCGQSDGGCTSCGTGGCSTCGKTLGKDLQDYFAGLRQKMEASRRVPLA